MVAHRLRRRTARRACSWSRSTARTWRSLPPSTGAPVGIGYGPGIALVAVVDEVDRHARLVAGHGDVRDAVLATATEVGVELLVRAAGEDRVDVVLRVRGDRERRDVAVPRVVGGNDRAAAERAVLVAGAARRHDGAEPVVVVVVVGGGGRRRRASCGGGAAEVRERRRGRRRIRQRARGQAGGERGDERDDPHVSPIHTSLSAFSRRELEAAHPYDAISCSLRSRVPRAATSGPSTCTASCSRSRWWSPRGSPRPGGGGAGTARAGIADIAFWVAVWGVIGARLYHVITDYQLFEHDCRRVFQIWKGGLVDLGRGDRRRDRGDRHHAAPAHAHARGDGLPRARAPRRAGDRSLGELVQPGALREADHAPVGARDLARAPAGRDTSSTRRSNPRSSTSRSTACSIVGILLLVERKLPLKQGQTFALYVIFYTFGRFWFENLRIDPAHDIGPLRVNAWVSLLIFAFGIGWFWWLGRHEPRQRRPGHEASAATLGN